MSISMETYASNGSRHIQLMASSDAVHCVDMNADQMEESHCGLVEQVSVSETQGLVGSHQINWEKMSCDQMSLPECPSPVTSNCDRLNAMTNGCTSPSGEFLHKAFNVEFTDTATNTSASGSNSCPEPISCQSNGCIEAHSDLIGPESSFVCAVENSEVCLRNELTSQSKEVEESEMTYKEIIDRLDESGSDKNHSSVDVSRPPHAEAKKVPDVVGDLNMPVVESAGAVLSVVKDNSHAADGSDQHSKESVPSCYTAAQFTSDNSHLSLEPTGSPIVIDDPSSPVFVSVDTPTSDSNESSQSSDSDVSFTLPGVASSKSNASNKSATGHRNVTVSSRMSAPFEPDSQLVIIGSAEKLPGVRPVAKLLQDTGLLLASEKVFKYLVKIQKRKLASKRTVSDTQLLEKLKSSHSNIVARNADFSFPVRKCSCGRFKSESEIVMDWHGRSLDVKYPGTCCLCYGGYSYRTRVQFERHLSSFHERPPVGAVPNRSYSCQTCPLDLNIHLLMDRHQASCKRQFVLSRNLSPSEADEDIPIKHSTPVHQLIPNNDVAVLVSSPVKRPAQSLHASATSKTTVTGPAVNQSTSATRKGTFTSLVSSKNQLVSIDGKYFQILPGENSAGSLPRQQQLNSALPSNSVKMSQSHRKPKHVAKSDMAGDFSPLLGSNTLANSKYVTCTLCNGFVSNERALKLHMSLVHGEKAADISKSHRSVSLSNSKHTAASASVRPKGISKSTSKPLCSETLGLVHCWLCTPSRLLPSSQCLSHLSDGHNVTMAGMMDQKQCLICAGKPKLRGVDGFERHMLTLHSVLFPTPEMLWDAVERCSVPRLQASYNSSDGTLQCQRCASNFISRAFLCRHVHMVHGGQDRPEFSKPKSLSSNRLPLGNKVNGEQTSRSSPALLFVIDKSDDESDAVAVVISDDEDEATDSKRARRLSHEETNCSLKNRETVVNESRINQLMEDENDVLMDKVEEVLEIDGETVLIVKGDDEDDYAM